MRPEAPKVPISAELLSPCEPPLEISEEMTFQQKLNTLVINHGIYAKCYLKQKGLSDAVIRRN